MARTWSFPGASLVIKARCADTWEVSCFGAGCLSRTYKQDSDGEVFWNRVQEHYGGKVFGSFAV